MASAKPIKQGRKSKYEARFVQIVQMLAENPSSIMTGSWISDAKLGKLLGGFSGETIRTWRSKVPGHEGSYQPAFAKALKDCQAAIDTDAIKRGIIEKARGFVQVKTRFEKVLTGPPLPAASWTKTKLIGYAKQHGAAIDEAKKKDALYWDLLNWAQAQRKETLVPVSREQITQAADVAAARLALHNLQPPRPQTDERVTDGEQPWDVSEKIDLAATISPMRQLLDEIGEQTPKLPSEE